MIADEVEAKSFYNFDVYDLLKGKKFVLFHYEVNENTENRLFLVACHANNLSKLYLLTYF